VVCVVSGMRGPLYSLWRSVPAIFIHGNKPNHHQEDQRKLLAKMHLDGTQGGSVEPLVGSAGPTLPPLATVLLWETAWWALMSDSRCWGLVGRFGLSCGPLLLLLHRTRYFVTSPAYSSCFLLIPNLCS